jgi:hypothetical protein
VIVPDLIIFLVSFIITFISGYITHKKTSQNLVHIGKYIIHHSFVGLFLIVISFFVFAYKELLFAIGLGIYLSHTIEEILFNKVNYLRAFFIIITVKAKRDNSYEKQY